MSHVIKELKTYMLYLHIPKSSNMSYLLKLHIIMQFKSLAGELCNYRTLMLNKIIVQYDLSICKQKIILWAKGDSQMTIWRR